MSKWIIDTDTGSDDAIALLLAVKSGAEICAVTTVCGNIPLAQATKNALMTLEVCDAAIPVYEGAKAPLVRPLVTATEVHGGDGMGDCDLIHPTANAWPGVAADVILDTVRRNPDQVEILALGPLTNLALAILYDKKTMQKVKHIHSMGTAGFGAGNITPVAEFNVFVDAEAYKTVLESGIPMTLYGFDLCLGDAEVTGEDVERLLAKHSPTADFAVACTAQRLAYNRKKFGRDSFDLPDPVAAAVAFWPEIATQRVPCYCHCCTRQDQTYGQVILYDKTTAYTGAQNVPPPNATVVKKINPKAFREKLIEML